MNDTVLVALITSVFSLIAAFLMALPGIKAYRSQKQKTEIEAKKTEAETIEIYSNLAKDAVQREMEKSGQFSRLQQQFDELKSEFKEVVSIVYSWANGIEILIDQLRKKDCEPLWTPDPDDIEKIKTLKAKTSVNRSEESSFGETKPSNTRRSK